MSTYPTFTQETIMSQRAQQNSDPKHAPMSQHKRQETPITGASPDDPIGVDSDQTGKPARPMK
jgi:hypothetical protein